MGTEHPCRNWSAQSERYFQQESQLSFTISDTASFSAGVLVLFDFIV